MLAGVEPLTYLLCNRLTKLRVKRRLSLQEDASQVEQSVCDAAQGTTVRVAALA